MSKKRINITEDDLEDIRRVEAEYELWWVIATLDDGTPTPFQGSPWEIEDIGWARLFIKEPFKTREEAIQKCSEIIDNWTGLDFLKAKAKAKNF
jgi:hypothetical protein